MQDTQADFYKKLLGRKGEDLAVKYLKKKGYKILKRNFKCTFGEADIIAEQDKVLIFIEVKTRNGEIYGRGIDAVDEVKQRKYRKIAEYYVYHNDRLEQNVRFDVIETDGDIGVNHIENAF